MHLAKISIRRPKAALAVWGAFAAVLIAIGFGVTDRLAPNNTLVDGTDSARATSLAESRFGPSVLVPVLLEGPKAQLDRQGPALVRKLSRRGDTRVLSAWDAGDAGRELRPSATKAMLIASVAHSESYMVDTGQARLDRFIDGSLTGPVRARISGTATLDWAINDLLATAATFGVVTVLTRGSDPVLGGPGYVDSLQVIETFAAVFGIALLFEMPLLWRARELFLSGSTPHEALAQALRETATAATGAAAVIVAAVVPFLMSGLFNLRLTIGLAIVIVIDALLVRPVLLPAAAELLGRRGWWPSRQAGAKPPARRHSNRFRRARRPRHAERVSPR